VIATKYTGNPKTFLRLKGALPPGEGVSANGGGNSRKSMVENLDASLKRLGTGYVDIFYVHFWEYTTPIEEVVRSLDDVVRSGKALYVAVSDTPAWVISRSNTISELRGLSPYIGLQTRYNLLDRSMEGELGPMAETLGLGIVPWGILAEGYLTGKHKKDQKMESSGRNESVGKHMTEEKNQKILAEVLKIAEEIGRTPAQVSLNWMLQKPVTSPIVGAKNVAQLEDNLKALEFVLTPDQMKRLNEVSAPAHAFPASMLARMPFFVDGGYKVKRPAYPWL
jgi:aryl-alcohol dehydrogenase-like predicted oxidoreductase